MKQQLLLLLLLPVAVAFSACDNYGKKISVGQSEVYYKGEGVTPQDAEKTGAFLLQKELISKDKQSSAQVIKEGNTYVVRLVMAHKEVDPALKLNFWKLQSDLSKEVFNGADARFALTDDHFDNEELLDPVNTFAMGRATVFYDSGAFKKDAISNLANFFKEQELLSEEKEANMFVRKEDNIPVIRVVYDKAFMEANEEQVLPVFGYLQHLIQTNYPAFKTARIWLTTQAYQDFKKIPELSADEVARFENAGGDEAATTGSNASPTNNAGEAATPQP